MCGVCHTGLFINLGGRRTHVWDDEFVLDSSLPCLGEGTKRFVKIIAATCSCWIRQAATKMMAKQGVPGHIVFVGSTLGYLSFIDWTGYSPGKHALVGMFISYQNPIIITAITRTVAYSKPFPNFQDSRKRSLRSELALYHIKVQLFQAGTVYTPGFENENKTKPAITKRIEEGGDGMTPEQAAVAMLRSQFTLYCLSISLF
jgi:NADP-dependent 3-hydroxy acid dehydrogenase YdfG